MALLERPATPVLPAAVARTSAGHAPAPRPVPRPAAGAGGRVRSRARQRVPRWTPLVWLALLADHRRHARQAVRSGAMTPSTPHAAAVPAPAVVPITTPRTASAEASAPAAGPGLGTRPAVIAHRGNSSVAPQNTLAAIEAACRAGADAVEIDLQRTSDGAAVVIHDDTVDATTDGHGVVAELNLATLRGLDAGRWFGPGYAGQQVPLFGDVLELLGRYPGVQLLLELKDVWGPDELRGVTAAIDEAGLEDRVVVQCFWPDTVAAARDVAPHLPRGLLLAFEPPDVLDVCAGLGVIACNPSAEMVRRDPGIVTRLHRAGLRVMVWTENDPSGWSHLISVDDGAGVDAVITDRPDRLLGWLSR
ncbi:glycerophosphodiester phosphodiesterase [Myceligenerans crystallogenes]|uniref:GP-PDE domain-containing protein n=1 Tax=Myceligenerans crystallogenes TaxID=316335 RepID=A0ABN2NGL3_9MICO